MRCIPLNSKCLLLTCRRLIKVCKAKVGLGEYMLCMIAFAISCAESPDRRVPVADPGFSSYYQSRKAPRVTIMISNYDSSDIESLQVRYIAVNFSQEIQVSGTSQLDENGTCRLELNTPLPFQQIWLNIGDIFYTGILVHDSLCLHLDLDSLEPRGGKVMFNGKGVYYQGPDGPMNTYLNNHTLFRRNEQLRLSRERNLTIQNEDYEERVRIVDSVFAAYRSIDSAYADQYPSPFDWIIRNSRQSDYLRTRISVSKPESIDELLFETAEEHEIYTVSNSSALLLNGLIGKLHASKVWMKYFDWRRIATVSHDMEVAAIRMLDSLNQYENCKDMGVPFDTTVYRQLRRAAVARFSAGFERTRNVSLMQVLDSIYDPPLADILKMFIPYNSLRLEQHHADSLSKTMQIAWCRDLMRRRSEEMQTRLKEVENALMPHDDSAAGSMKETSRYAFGARLFTTSTEQADSFVYELRKMAGKRPIIMDFWATWCGACYAAMPKLNILQESVDDSTAVFFFICGGDSTLWRKAIEKYKIQGNHIFVDDRLQADLMKSFSLSGFPSYFCIADNKIQRISNLGSHTRESLLAMLDAR